MLLSASLALALGLPAPARAQDVERIHDVLQKAMEAHGDAAVLKARLVELEALLGARSDSAPGEYARGWILSHLGRNEEAVVAYDRAVAIAPRFGSAWYNGANVLSDLGRRDEAVAHWKRALDADPKLVDAAYNLGQYAYDRKEFASALEWWQRARALAPDDLGVVKKVLQAQNALGRWEDARATRAEVLRLHRTSRDAEVRALSDFCFDQLDVDKAHVFALEPFDAAGDDAVLLRFTATRPDAKTWGTVTVRGSAGKDGPVRLEVHALGTRVGEPIPLDALPEYGALRERVRALVRERVAPVIP